MRATSVIEYVVLPEVEPMYLLGALVVAYGVVIMARLGSARYISNELTRQPLQSCPSGVVHPEHTILMRMVGCHGEARDKLQRLALTEVQHQHIDVFDFRSATLGGAQDTDGRRVTYATYGGHNMVQMRDHSVM